MASAALRSGGIEGEGLLVDRGDGSFFALLSFCCGGEYRYLAMAGRFCARRQRLLATDHGTGFSGRSLSLGSSLLVLFDKGFERGVWIDFFDRACILGEPQSGLGLYGLGLPSLAEPGDSILTKECAVTQYGARESAGKHRIAHQPFPPIDFRLRPDFYRSCKPRPSPAGLLN